jgi:hypothetical protein
MRVGQIIQAITVRIAKELRELRRLRAVPSPSLIDTAPRTGDTNL